MLKALKPPLSWRDCFMVGGSGFKGDGRTSSHGEQRNSTRNGASKDGADADVSSYFTKESNPNKQKMRVSKMSWHSVLFGG